MYKLILFLLLLFSSGFAADQFITYEFSGGRFGDQLLSYLHAKWLAHRHQMTLLYKPFQYSTELTLSDKEIQYTHSYLRSRFRVQLGQGQLDPHSPHSTLYICPYFPEDKDELIRAPYGPYSFHIDVDWKDEEFRKIALELIAPKKPLQLIEPPKDTVNIAIHVREGGGYDPDSFRTELPLKLPPLSFYFEAFPMILDHFRGLPIYCHIFTDSQKPEELVKAFKQLVPPNLDVTFGCRKQFNRHNSNVLIDFFSLFNFDVLIRSQSNFSLLPSLLHDFALVHCPTGFSLSGKTVTIEKAETLIHDELYQTLIRGKQ